MAVYNLEENKLYVKCQEGSMEHMFCFDYFTAEQVMQIINGLDKRIKTLENELRN